MLKNERNIIIVADYFGFPEKFRTLLVISFSYLFNCGSQNFISKRDKDLANLLEDTIEDCK